MPWKRVEEQSQEARVPDGDERQVSGGQQEEQRQVAEGLDVGDEAEGGGHGQRRLHQPPPAAAQVLGVVLEADPDTGAIPCRCVRQHGSDGPVAATARESRVAAHEVHDPRSDRAPQLPLQRGGVGDPLRGRRSPGGLQHAHRRAGQDVTLAGRDPIHPRRDVLPPGQGHEVLVLGHAADARKGVGAAERGVAVLPEVADEQVLLRPPGVVERRAVTRPGREVRTRPGERAQRRDAHACAAGTSRVRSPSRHMRRPAGVRFSSAISVRHTSSSPCRQPGLLSRKNATWGSSRRARGSARSSDRSTCGG